MRVDAAIVLIAVAGLLGYVGGHHRGEVAGKTAEAGKRDAQTVQDLTSLITKHSDLVKQSQLASSQMRRAVAVRQSADEAAAKEFRHALATTAPDRADCVFPAGVMRSLDAARDRAAQAAASGVRGALPAAPANPE